MSDFDGSDKQGAEYALGYLRAKFPQVDCQSAEIGRIAAEVIGNASIGNMSRDQVDRLCGQIADKWDEDHTLGGQLEAWQRENGLA